MRPLVSVAPHLLGSALHAIMTFCPSFLSGSTAQDGPWSSQEALSRSTFFLLVFLVLKTRRSFSRPSIHPRFGLPFLRVPIAWALKTFLLVRCSSILTVLPAHLIRCILNKLTISDSLYE
ncbi:uncharacterized protein TNCV_357471 [Trichonephila clavipes]|nr:uncharacterized protein TNCV_357471 [Trichonephila clavipes]